ncbi:hypothetical protein ZWY2020_057829 [Hordeum vulgare]|nr:hypothetical protein ZWY2020_057829 [Hordeum vulgare]
MAPAAFRVEVPAIGAAASGFLPGQENYIIHMISQLSNDFIAEQRRLQDDNSRLLQEVKDMRRELISGKDLVAESRRVLEENVKIYQEVKDSSTTMKAHVVSESNKVTKEVQEFREEIRGMTENCRLYLGKMAIRTLLAIVGLVFAGLTSTVPYVWKFVVYCWNKTWETVMKPKDE